MKTLQEIYDKICELETKADLLEVGIIEQDNQIVQLGLINNLFVEAGLIQMVWSWEDLPVGSFDGVSIPAALAYTPSGQPAIAHYVTGPEVKYSVFDGSSWTTSHVASLAGGGFSGNEVEISLAFTPQGHPAIAFHDPGDESLKYAAFNPSVGWQVSTVRTAPFPGLPAGLFASMAFSPAGQPWIFYTRIDLSNHFLSYSEFNGTIWVHQDLETTSHPNYSGKFCAFKFNSDGRPVVAYEDSSSGQSHLRIAEHNGTSWQFTTVDATNGTGSAASLGFTPQRWPAISYFNDSTNELMYASFNGLTWSKTAVAPVADDIEHTSLAFSAAGRPAIAYSMDSNNAPINYATFDGTLWKVELVADELFTTLGGNSALQFSPTGQPQLIFSNDAPLAFAKRGPFTNP